MSVTEPHESYDDETSSNYLERLGQSQDSIHHVVEKIREMWGVEEVQLNEDTDSEDRTREELERDLNGVDLEIPRLDLDVAVKTKSPDMLDGRPYWDIPLRQDGRQGGASEWERFKHVVNEKDPTSMDALPDYVFILFGDEDRLRGWLMVEVKAIIKGMRDNDIEVLTKGHMGGRFKLLDLVDVFSAPTEASRLRFTEEHLARRFAREKTGDAADFVYYHEQ